MGLGPSEIITGGCSGGGCSGGQCSGGGCGGGSCGGSGCGNNPANSVECQNRLTLDDSGYKGGQGLDLARQRLEESLKEYYEFKCNRKVIDNVHYIDTKRPCDGSQQVNYSMDMAYRCIGGTWHYADAGIVQDIIQEYTVEEHSEPLYMQIGQGIDPCKEEPIYDHHGCIIGYKPFLVSEGEFGIWNTTEIYPMTKNCGDEDEAGHCEYVYGDLAGKNVRLFRTPSVSKEPFYIGGRTGVPNRYESGGMEDDGAYVFMIGLKVEGITPYKNPPKPRCKVNPFTITYVERTEANKSVIGSGLMINTFLGNVSGQVYAVPKIGLNGPEYYDVHINNGNKHFRGGTGENDKPGYVFHSPDLHLHRPSLDAYRIIMEGESHGYGFRYGLYDKGDPPENIWLDRKQQKGARQAINLSNFTPFGEPVVRCVRSLSYVRADSVLSNDDKFSYPLLNTYKESCAYLELNAGSGKVELINNQTEFDPMPTGSSVLVDKSFIGDTKDHERILRGAATYATVTRYIPNQYGSPILQTYIPIGLEVGADKDGNPNTGASGLVGDSFVGGYSIKRTSYVSDKVPRAIVTEPAEMEFGSLKLFSGLIKGLYRIIGIIGWAELPVSGNEGDFINKIHLNNRNDGTMNGEGQDIYYPSVVKTNIWGYYNSDSNLYFRETGLDDLGEVHIHRLKNLRRDSAYPIGTKWKFGYLNRFYIPWNKPSGFKRMLFTILLILWTFGVGLWFIFDAFRNASLIIVGIDNSVLAWVFWILEFVVGIAWIVLWSSTSKDNKIIANWLGMDLERPDHQWPVRGTDPRASRWSMKEGRVVNFEDNYHKINHDYSIPNNVEKGFGMGDPYMTCECPCEKTNEIIYSNKQNQGSHIDAWANFKSNLYTKIDAGLGRVTKIFKMYGTLYAHTTDHIVPISRGGREGGEFMMSSGSIMEGVQEGYGGLWDPNAAEVTPWGYIYPDREAREWYLFTGGKPIALGDYGVRQFLNEHMNFKLLEEYPDFNLVDKKTEGGIGYSIGVDHENKYIFLTKVDYITKSECKESKPQADKKTKDSAGCPISAPMKSNCNKSWTLTFDIEKRQFVGFEYFTPHLYSWNRFHMYSYDSKGMWRHNQKGLFQTFYGKYYPSMIEVIAIDRTTYDDWDYQGTIIDTEAYQWRGHAYVRSSKITYNNLVSYNSHQNTGMTELHNNNDELTPTDRSRGSVAVVNLEFKGRRWQFKRLVDRLRDFDELQWEQICEVQPMKVNESNIGDEHNHSFNDNHIGYRFYFNKHNDVKLFFKRLITTNDVEHDVTQ